MRVYTREQEGRCGAQRKAHYTHILTYSHSHKERQRDTLSQTLADTHAVSPLPLPPPSLLLLPEQGFAQ